MAIIEGLSRALEGAVKRKRNVSGKLRSKAARVAGGSSEVMVKVTSYGKGAEHVKAHLDYITRNGKIEMENDRGEIFTGKAEVNDFFKDWERDFDGGKQQKERRDTLHMVLSMPTNTPSEAVRSAVRDFTKHTFGENHEYAFALHCPENDDKTLQPHCHVTVKMLGHNGKRLNPGRMDLANWREDFAQAMRDQGVDAEATRRKSRGVIRKAENTIVKHIEKGDKTHQPRHSKVKALQELEAINEIKAEHHGQTEKVPIWEVKIKAEQEAVRAAWLTAAKALDKEPPKPIYKTGEQLNDRPDYTKLHTISTRRNQRLGAVYQSNLGKTDAREPPRSLSSLRDLPRINVVHDSQSDKVLLHSDARNSLGRGRGTDIEMRRQRISDIGTLGSSKWLIGIKSAIDDDKVLAARITGFVEDMPSIKPKVLTLHNITKQNLLDEFTKPRDQEKAKPSDIKPSPKLSDIKPIQGQKKDADITAAPDLQKEKGQER